MVWKHPANRGRRMRAIFEGGAWLLYRVVTDRPIERRGPLGFRYYCCPDSNFCKRMAIYNGQPDYHEMRFMRHYLRCGEGFLDVGANNGIYSLLAARLVGETGRVDACEPGATALRRLRENVALNRMRQVEVHPVAIGAERGTVRFLLDYDDGNRIRTDADAGKNTVEVPCVPLRDIVKDRGYALGKLDLEGAEPVVLGAAEELLAAANPPVWLLELNGKLIDFGFTEAGFADWLEGRGYDLALYDSDRRRFRFGKDVWKEPSYEPWETNVLAIARQAREMVMARIREH